MSHPSPTPSPAPAPGDRASIDRVIGALEARGYPVQHYRRNSFMAGCPVHDDANPSLHVTWRTGPQGGFVMLFCHGCQAPASQLVEALGLTMTDLFDVPLPDRDLTSSRTGKSPASRRAGRRRGKLGRLPNPVIQPARPTAEIEHSWVEVERYPYRDHDGQLVQEVIREECTGEGNAHKQFRQVFVTRDGRRVKHKPDGFTAVLYRAPEVAAAVQDDREIWILEGEKDVHTAERFGLVATTNTQGGRSFPDELIDELAGARVVVVLDRDATGWARGVDLHAKLTAVDCQVRLRLPAVTRPKADLTDHVEAGHGLDELIDVAVEEVAAWHALTAVEAKARLIDQAALEAHERWELAQHGEQVEENTRFARRWALETQIRHDALRDLVDQVYGHGLRVGTEWSAEAMDAADRLLNEAAGVARRSHLEVGVPVPASLRSDGNEHNDRANESPPDTAASQTRHPSSPSGRPNDSPPAAETAAPATWGQSGSGVSAPVFRVLDGQIVQWEPDRRRRDDDDEPSGKFKVLLTTVVRVTRREYLEVDIDDDVEETQLLGRSASARPRVTRPRKLAAVRVEFPDPASGEQMEIRVLADEWRDHSWLESLPGQPDYDHRKTGLDQLQRAILAISDDVEDETLYRATGWRDNPDGTHRFIHARGAIGPNGHEDLEVAFEGPLRRYDLPDPVNDAEALRRAWLDASATMLDRIPERVAAPLLGQAFRAVLGPNEWVLTLVGPPGSYKTSVAAKVMHHFGERWEHKKPASSMSGNGDTFNALRLKLHYAKDALYWADDFAPTKSWLEAQRHLEETARLIHNQEERSRSSRDGLSISDGTGPRATGLFTSEVMPRPGSASERMLVVPLASRDVDKSLLFPLDEPLSRHGRALIMSSYICWLAADLKAKRMTYLRAGADYADNLVRLAGETVRQADAISQTWVGWLAMTDFLVESGAITAPEQIQTLTRVDKALHDAAQAAVNPDMPRTTGARVRELLAYALQQGLAYVDDVRTGECPPWPLASRLGWRRTITELDHVGVASKYRLERNGMRLGYVLHDPGPRERGRLLMCDSTQLEAVLKAAGATQAERLEIDRNTACRALHDEGVLIADESEKRTRHTIKCQIYAEDRVARMVALYLDKIINDGPGSDSEPALGDPKPGTDDGNSGQDTCQPDLMSSPPDSSPGGSLAGSSERPPSRLQSLDSVRPVVEPGHVAAGQADGWPAPDQPGKEGIPVAKSPSPWTDREGVVGWVEPTEAGDIAPCLMCGRPAAIVIAGLRIHPVCWKNSTAAERRAAAVPAAAVPAAMTHATVAAHSDTVQADHPTPAPNSRPVGQSRPQRSHVSAGASSQGSGEFRAAAAVVDVDGIWLSNGEQMPMPGEGPNHVGDLVRLAQWLRLGTQTTKYLSAGGQIWVADQLAAQMGIDIEAIAAADEREQDKVTREVTKDSPAVAGAIQAGYRIGGRDGDNLGRWTRVWKGEEKSVWIVLLPAVSRDDAAIPLLSGDPDHATLARRIGLLAGALGHPYQLSGSTTGLDLMTALRWKDRDKFFVAREPVQPAKQSNTESDISWSREPTAEERGHEWVHAYDRSGSYLAGVSGLELGVGEPVHHPDGVAFQPKVPGYWRIEIPDAGDWRYPNPLDPRGINAGKVRWITTPALEFAVDLGYEPEIQEAYIWQEHARVLDPWYERIRDARTQLDTDDPDAQIARDQLKQIYAPTIGMLGSEIHMAGRPGYAPERRHMIISKARTNILRRVVKIGQDTDRWPVAIIADTVIYTSPDPDPVAAWPGEDKWLGRALGRYKIEGSASLESQLQYLTGGAYKGKDALTGRAPGAE